jgi:pyruvate dehydrogenase E2 component (dihydrolipoamide acetyltransferase)
LATEVRMPKLGATMESGIILKWFKQEGDTVEAGEPLVEIMTDKINIEVEADVSGVLLQIRHQADEEVPVNEVIAYIGQVGEEVTDVNKPHSVSAPAAAVANADEAKQASSADIVETNHSSTKLRKTPAAQKLARLHGVDLCQVKGTGPKGRIQRKDVEAYIETGKTQVKATPLAHKVAEERKVDLSGVKGSGANGKIMRDDVIRYVQEQPRIETEPVAEERIKLDGIRKVIAQRMVESAFTAPHVTLVSEVDMSNCIRLRNELLPVIEKRTGYRLSYTEIIMKFVAHTLRKHPIVNATLKDDYIVFNPQVNIGLAVSIPTGLIVPVIKDADQKGLAALTAECKQVSALAREGKLQPDRLASSTFTVSNLGMYAVDAFTPIINQPESAILGVGRINEKAVGINGSIELRPMMTLSLSFDHRVIDGAPAAAFLTDLKVMLENPFQVLV